MHIDSLEAHTILNTYNLWKLTLRAMFHSTTCYDLKSKPGCTEWQTEINPWIYNMKLLTVLRKNFPQQNIHPDKNYTERICYNELSLLQTNFGALFLYELFRSTDFMGTLLYNAHIRLNSIFLTSVIFCNKKKIIFKLL